MSAISPVSTGFDSPADLFEQEKYQRSITTTDNYVHAPAEMEKRVNSLLEKRIQPLSDGRGMFSQSSVDSTVVVKGVSDIFCKDRIEKWKKIEEESLNTRNKAVVGMWSSVLAGMLVRAMHSKNDPAALAIGVIGVTANIIFALLAQNKITQAKEQQASWNTSPAEGVARERTEAYKRGFMHVYNHSMKIEKEGSKNGVLHPLEVRTMFERYFPNFSKSFAPASL